MGTRCLTIINNNDGREIAVMYRQCDGYPSCHGKELAKYCSDRTIVNGYGSETDHVANGMTCLAAQIVSEFKDAVGGIYLYSSGTRDCWEEYTYTISGEEGFEANIKVESYGEELFSGPASKLLYAIESGDID